MTETKHRVTIQAISDDRLTLVVDGTLISAEWSMLSERLSRAPLAAREVIEISSAGYGLHWPLVDEDLSIDGILRDFGAYQLYAEEGKKNPEC